jgi:hypothetical protein
VIAKKTFSETYTVIADLEGGVYLQLQVGVSNLGFSSRRGACRALLIEPGSPTWSQTAEVPESDWSYERGGRSELRVGPCSLSGGDETDFHVALGGQEIDLRLAAPIRPVRPLDRRMTVGSNFYESDIMIPWAPAEASIRAGAGEPRVLRGHGYGDHSRSTTLPAALARRWVRFRGLADTDSILLLARFPRKDEPLDGWIWQQGEPAPVGLKSVELTALGATSGGGGQWVITLESDSGARYRVTTESELHRNAPLEGRGMLGRMLRPLVGNPVTYTYRARLQRDGADVGEKSLSGIAEITFVDK